MSKETGQNYAEEVRERWGGTGAYAQSQGRTKSYTDADWAAIKAELELIEAEFADVMGAGDTPDSDAAVALAERARLHIDQRYYTCSHEMHASLADMYTSDDRFRAHYDDRAEGLAGFVAAAIKANADRHSG